ncbi:hypothetical protein [Methylobacterium sp. Leaf108]|uniref:hypothetical protein n=1 Tax=Methylobacterium sp. Leaf108 TaxID=1736256 RepID=UPI000A8BF9E2|nr:hypothetical protein [Methylobacterium sp. Leaf108]
MTRRLPAPNAMRNPAMLTPLASPPKVIAVDTGGLAAAAANPAAIIFDREARCLRRGNLRVSLRSGRVYGLTGHILGALPKTETLRAEAARVADIGTSHDLSLYLRQVRRNLHPFGLGIATTWGGRIVLTAAEASPC